MTLRDLLVISGLCALTEDADEAIRLSLTKEVVHLFGEDAFERMDAIEASNEETVEVMLQILRSLAVDQELLDVKAGIPARDAEIEALRKQVETLQGQLVDKSPETQGKPVDELPNLQAQQQPVIDADGLTQEAWEEWKSRAAIAQRVASIPAVDKALEVFCNEGTADNAVALVRAVMTALAQLSGNPGQPDHLPDATKMVEPSGNSGELPDAVRVPLDSLHADAVYLLSRVKQVTLSIHDAAQSIRSRIEATCAALAQQDADKVDAEQWISVNERLPEIHEWRAGSIAGISDAVLTIDEDDPDTMTVQHLRKGGQGDLTTLYWDHGDSPTHWRPAPSLPGIDAARKEPDQ
ncbi:DUF551 domain-containing protein [Alcaligenes faecalis]|uniref:DUF551 domain-containing protein n=1 Tax=Alcaligenes faecalis TaxID=511 RepID=UPI001EF0D59F|nr:DUF551 domain-containing protein [Alcaligenes faecalis]ULH08189.1 DUF551 domain-containing protein [Alcaligenes faecalis]